MNGRNVGVVERGEHLRLPLEPSEAIRIIGKRLRQDFEGHITVEIGVSGPIHLAHAAFADPGGDGVRAKCGTRGIG